MDLTVLVVGLVAGQLAFGRLRPLPAARPGGLPPVTVVIPARDEAATLPHLLGDLAADPEAGRRVVVVDDHSSDGTAALAAAAGAEVLEAPAVPEDWYPKSWACHHGATRAGAEDVLVFLDADVRLAPGALASIVGEVVAHGGLVSVVPLHTMPERHEPLSIPFNIVAVMGSGAGHRRPTGAFGPVMASPAADYRRVGGHAAVADHLVEDVALARCYRQAGLGVTLRAGAPAVRWRMYPRSLRTLWDGWAKNLATGARATRPAALAAIAAWVTALTSVSLGWARLGPLADEHVGVTVVASAAVAAQLRWFLRRVGSAPWWTVVAFPVLIAVFLATFARSLLLTAGGGSVRWRGRRLPVRSPRGTGT